MTKLFVGGLPYAMNDQALNDLFAEYGTVTSAVVITDRSTGQSKGFGFVELEDDAMAQKAIEELNGKDVEGRSIAVSVARPREER
ncbi:MAG TPA: RNA-binding protein [Candidatus Levybacteria bacterium]|mgnify:CR=1 FL=1|nr:RNA-binding protein [Candidatus Levybacteria bacterium]